MPSREQIAAIIVRNLFADDPTYMPDALTCADDILKPESDAEPSSTETRAALAAEAYALIYEHTESFHGTLGSHVAYLVGGILTGQGVAYHDQLDEGEQEFIDTLREIVLDAHPVWEWIDLSEAIEITDDEDENDG